MLSTPAPLTGDVRFHICHRADDCQTSNFLDRGRGNAEVNLTLIRRNAALFVYTHRSWISVVTFFLILSIADHLFGYTSCRDGWDSPSIGNRGACSHHGGVDSNGGVLFMLSAVATLVLWGRIDAKYRVFGRYIVPSSLPRHPRESELMPPARISLHKAAKLSAKSRRSFTCKGCRKEFPAGTEYRYHVEHSERVRYCHTCAKGRPALNAAIKAERDAASRQWEALKKEIDAYYERHALNKDG